jgi:hypothetical protein
MEHEYTVEDYTLYRDGEAIGTHIDPAKLRELADTMNRRQRELADASRLMRERSSVCG